jgi:hypothetical protein
MQNPDIPRSTARGESRQSASAQTEHVAVIVCAELLPATEKGGQGTPAANKSAPSHWRPSTCRMSACRTGHCGRFKRRVAQQSGSISTAPTHANPAISRPMACPPPPVQHSITVKGIVSHPVSHFIFADDAIGVNGNHRQTQGAAILCFPTKK